MIKTEYYMTRPDGVNLYRTYSTHHYRIIQDGSGAIYDEAIDPENSGRTYTESDQLIEIETTDNEALNILLGREVG